MSHIIQGIWLGENGLSEQFDQSTKTLHAPIWSWTPVKWCHHDKWCSKISDIKMSLQSFSCIEKIKSTGATYMAASGLGGEQCHHNQNVHGNKKYQIYDQNHHHQGSISSLSSPLSSLPSSSGLTENVIIITMAIKQKVSNPWPISSSWPHFAIIIIAIIIRFDRPNSDSW